MIELIPAIDIIDGKCVRLSQGDYDSKKVYNENPVEYRVPPFLWPLLPDFRYIPSYCHSHLAKGVHTFRR